VTVNFVIPGALLDYTGSEGEILVEGDVTSLDEALALLCREHPAIRDRILTEENAVRPHVNIFVNGESIRFTGGLGAAVADGAEVVILPAISGG
jgi:molybdopterin converting factor small subunit